MATENNSNEKILSPLKEGAATILVPEGPQGVFYNPIQQFNRDLSVLAIRAFGEDYLARKVANPSRRARQKLNKLRRVQEAEEKQKDGDELPEKPPAKRQKLDSEDEGIPIARISNNEPHVNGSDLKSSEVDQNDTTADELKMRGRVRILDALSATGLRALRYAKELTFPCVITANDMSKDATESIKQNVEQNNLSDRISVSHANAQAYMYAFANSSDSIGSDRERYDVIDLDPYGTAVPFLDAALQALKNGGLLCVTCTDAGVFASIGYLEKTFSLYGGLPTKGLHCHEAGLRLILHSISTTAAKYGKYVEPLLSLSIDFYARIFVRVRDSPVDVKFLAGKTMMVYNCDSGCGAWATQYIGKHTVHSGKNPKNIIWKHSSASGPTSEPKCQHCGFKTHLAGPMFGGPLHNPAFVERILSYLPTLDIETYQTIPRIEGMLITALEETEIIDELHPGQSAPSKPTQKPSASSRDHSKAGNENLNESLIQNQDAQDQGSKSSLPNDSLIPNLPPFVVDHHPFFFSPSQLSKVLHCRAPSEAAMKGALRNLGYRALRTHTKPGMVKTDAPWEVIWRIMRAWVRQEAPVRKGAVKEGMAGWDIWEAGRRRGEDGPVFIEKEGGKGEGVGKKGAAGEEMQQDVNADVSVAGYAIVQNDGAQVVAAKAQEIVFDEELGKDQKGSSKRLRRWQMNPRPNWGPMSRAKRGSRKAE
ncbi:MAG: RNA methyltransferase tRNA(m5U54)methyltransferase [Bogoriella megaspora]|nr:MAG: RNA methyltransferase tRNA(m5U54)methyltransferase [Bogoriella megaspora]